MRGPSAVRAVPRPRFYRAMDRIAAPVLWIAAPAGSGKTLGVAGYLAARMGAGIWYEVDAEDRDPGTLVAHLAKTLAGSGRGRASSSVRLTPVHPEALRQQSELLFGGLLSARRDRQRPLVLVLDNYQEADPSDAWNDLIAGLAAAWASAAPRGSRVLVTSRRRPPARLARLLADGTIAALDVDLLRFDEKEIRGLLRARRSVPGARKGGRPGLMSEAAQVRMLLALSGGWAVAAALLFRPNGADDAEIVGAAGFGGSDVESFFDYLAAEVARHLSVKARHALSCLAFVHRISPRTLAALAPDIEFDALVAEIGRVALPFTRDADGAIRLHDLVREFLRQRLVSALGVGERAQVLSASARLLSDDGHLQEAAALCRQAEAWDDLASLICAHAPTLIGQGRAVSVSAALQALPADRIDADPWLGLWRAVCELPGDPALAERRLGPVIQQFRSAGDGVGRKLAAACALQAIAIRGDDLRAALPLLNVLDEPLDQPLPPSIEARVRASRLMALGFLGPGSPASQRAADEALALSPDPSQVADAITSCALAAMVYLNAGRLEDADSAQRTAHALALTAPHDPLAQLTFLHQQAWSSLSLHLADGAAVVRAAEEGVALAKRSGIFAWRGNIAGMGCLGAVTLGDLPTAWKLLADMEEALNTRTSNYLRANFLYTRSWCWMAASEPERALADLRAAEVPVRAAGFDLGAAAVYLAEMIVLASLGRFEEVEAPRRALAGVLEIYNPPIVESTTEVVEAFVELLAHGPSVARPRLARALARAHELRVGLIVATGQFWATLVGAALELGIEPAYVAALVRRYRIDLPADDTGPVWPWPLVARTLGTFSLGGSEHRSKGTPSLGPLRLFKALVAAGGGPVRRERLVAELWPGTRGTSDRAIFDTTLHRLRRALGDESLVRFENGEVSLDRSRIWCDAWALVHLGKQVERLVRGVGPEEIDRLDRRLRALYRGPFCPDEQEPFIARARERLARAFVEAASALADAWLGAGEGERAVALLEAAIESDDLNEPLYAKLITVHAQRGAAAAGARVHVRCALTLRARLKVDPSPETARAAAALRVHSPAPSTSAMKR
jgi:LuxR family transcriptional regulator, maltose regulon positive regulatory protein